MPKYQLVDMSEIEATDSHSFVEEEIEALAELFLKTGVFASPLILKETSPFSYRVIAGHKAYHAAVKARQKHPRKGEMVNAFVLDRKDSSSVEEAILKQLPLLA